MSNDNFTHMANGRTPRVLSKRARRTLTLQMGEAMRQYAQANTMAERLCLQGTIDSCRERLEHNG